MIHTQSFNLAATKTLSTYLLPGTIVVLGGFLIWKLWQQTQQNVKQKTRFPQHIDDLQNQLDTLNKNTTSQPSISTAQTTTPINNVDHNPIIKSKKGTQKKGLFEHLINENIMIREAR